jgi:hypothetical protein
VMLNAGKAQRKLNYAYSNECYKLPHQCLPDCPQYAQE